MKNKSNTYYIILYIIFINLLKE